MSARRAAVLALAGACALAGCESTQDKSAKLAKAGRGQAQLTQVDLGAPNTDVHVLDTTVLNGAGGTHAVVVALRNDGRRAQAAVPIAVAVTAAGGKVVYRNDVAGLQAALLQQAYVDAGDTVFWVDDQVVAAARPRHARAQVGAARAGGAPRGVRLPVADLRTESDPSGAFITGTVRNTTGADLRLVPVYAVARRGRKVVAAGRAIIDKVAAGAPKPAAFRIYLVGSPDGATLDVRAYPTPKEAPAR